MKKMFFIIYFSMITALTFCQEDAIDKFQKAEKELSTVYNKVLVEYKTDTLFVKHLKQSQTYWKMFRDAEMEMKFPDTLNGHYSTPYVECVYLYKEKITRQRIDALRIWLEGTKENDECNGSLKIHN